MNQTSQKTLPIEKLDELETRLKKLQKKDITSKSSIVWTIIFERWIKVSEIFEFIKLSTKKLATKSIWKDLIRKIKSKTISQLAKMGKKCNGGTDETMIFEDWYIITKNWSISVNLWKKSFPFSNEWKNSQMFKRKKHFQKGLTPESQAFATIFAPSISN